MELKGVVTIEAVQLKDALISDAVEGKDILEEETPEWVNELSARRDLEIAKQRDGHRLRLWLHPTSQLWEAGQWLVRLPNKQCLIMTAFEFELLQKELGA